MPPFVFLAIAIIFEIIATSFLRASEGFTKLVPSIIVVLGYVGAFYCLSQALKGVPIGVAYAIWSGIGTAAISVIGAVVFKDSFNIWTVVGILLIVSGVFVLNLLGGASHAS
ncbi:MAG: multidrug efflux SMR transporter [Pleurocapsa minor GSE-CHR-MK-17-07R]|jgi:multidrug transporter EmrE-like cation transporter|nr:multidrug efflux SMR transporter [Pleurocapsa minor GSE-CHR-MK 17-07R]